MNQSNTSTATQTPSRTPRRPREVPGVTRPMTYEEYMAGPVDKRRYDILDGIKHYYTYGVKRLPSPTRDHQDVTYNIAERFRAYQRQAQDGRMYAAPADVLIRRNPTRTRQPDVLYISNARLGQNPPSDEAAPLSPAPELAVEVLSPSDTRRVRMAKIADYAAVAVLECWIVSMDSETVEVVALTIAGTATTAAVYGRGQSITSLTFPNLVVAVDDIFAL